MFDFWKFYKGLINKTDYFIDDYWAQFPEGHHCHFKKETLFLLKDNVAKKNGNDLSSTLAIICNDGADEDYTDILIQLLDEKWHESEEDIISILELIKDPKSVDKLYEVAINIPDYDDMRAVAKKCMWALSSIKTAEAIQKLEILEKSNDPIISENATFQLEHLNQNHKGTDKNGT